MPAPGRQFRPLACAFFARFFDGEVTGGGHDLKASFFWLLAFLAAPGALLPILLGQGSVKGPIVHGQLDVTSWGWSMVARFKGLDALRVLSLTDKTLYLGCALTMTALLTAIVWHTLLPDRRDALVLGALPVRPSAIVRARLAALAAYVALVVLAMHTLASLSFGVFLATGNTVEFAMRGVAAHFLASSAASAFVFLAVVGAQGLLLVLTGPRVFARVSPALQMCLVALTVAGVLALPAIGQSAADTLSHTGAHVRPWILWTPAMWFLGLYESILGTSDPTLTRLAWHAVTALAVAFVTTVVTYPVAYRRLVRSAVEQGPSSGARRWAFGPRIVATAISRNPRVRALSEFFLITIARVDRHRFVLAAALGLSVAWGAADWLAYRAAGVRVPSAALFTIPLSALVFLIGATRTAAAIPADAAPAWLFDVMMPAPHEARRALERTIAAVVVLPVVMASTGFLWTWWGARLALMHAVFLSSASALFLEIALWRFGSVPCTQPWRPERVNLRTWWPVYLASFFALTSGLASIESGMSAVLLDRGPRFEGIGWIPSIVILLVLGLAVLVRRAAGRAPSALADEANLGVLTDALRSGVADHSIIPMRPSPGDPAAAARRGSAMFASFAPQQTGDDPWFDELSMSPRHLWRDFLFALRRLRRSPAFALFSVGTLALGIGATTTVYSLASALTDRPMEIRDPARVVTIRPQNQEGDASLSWLDFQDLRSSQTAFAAMEAESVFPTALAGHDMTTVVNGTLVTGNYFQLLGVDALIGRSLQAADDRPEASPAVVLSESTWRTRFAADPSHCGRAD